MPLPFASLHNIRVFKDWAGAGYHSGGSAHLSGLFSGISKIMIQIILPIFILAVAGLQIHMVEEYFTNFGPAISRIFNVPWTEERFLALYSWWFCRLFIHLLRWLVLSSPAGRVCCMVYFSSGRELQSSPILFSRWLNRILSQAISIAYRKPSTGLWWKTCPTTIPTKLPVLIISPACGRRYCQWYLYLCDLPPIQKKPGSQKVKS